MTYKSHKALLAFLEYIGNPQQASPVLDLACGTGRSGLRLTQRGIPVVFADRSASALDKIKKQLADDKQAGRVWQVDLEQADVNPFDHQVFSAVICFRYLHRPLFPYILSAVEPGGLVIYETFTTDNRHFGRPNNPDFLLRPGELKTWFEDWQILHYHEGIQQEPDRAIAQLVARKPVVG